MNRNCYLIVHGLKNSGIPAEICQKIITFVVEMDTNECILIADDYLEKRKSLFSNLTTIYDACFGKQISSTHYLFREEIYFKPIIDGYVKTIKENYPNLLLTNEHIYHGIILSYLKHYEINFKYLEEDAVLSAEMGYYDKCYLNR
jgi:hypothetical protein